MPTKATAPLEAARHLWARAAGDTIDPEKISAAAERLCGALDEGLGRWIGREGYRALLERALAVTQAEHPALGSLHCLNGKEPVQKIAERPHGAGEVGAGMVALIAALIDLLGKVIGEEMAMRLVEHSGMPSGRAVAGNQARGGRSG